MNIGVLREKVTGEMRVALTPAVVRRLVESDHAVWVETGAGDGAMFPDDEYVRAGANISYSAADVMRRCRLAAKISVPEAAELEAAGEGAVLLGFYHMAVADHGLVEHLKKGSITAVGFEGICTADGRRPVLAAVSEIAGQMTLPIAAHLLRSSSGGRGILLGGSPGVAPARVAVLGAGVVGTWSARAAVAAGASVAVLDIDPEKLRSIVQHLPNVATIFADGDSVETAVAEADVLVGAVLVGGSKTPHVVTRKMVESMRPGSVIIDVAIDEGGCVETSRPTTVDKPTFTHNGVVHYCVPNLTADMARSASIAISHAAMPYLIRLAEEGIETAIRKCPDLANGVYAYRGECAQPQLAGIWQSPYRPLSELLDEKSIETTK